MLTEHQRFVRWAANSRTLATVEPTDAEHHRERAAEYADRACALMEEAVLRVINATPAQLEYWLSSRDHRVRTFVIEHLDRGSHVETRQAAPPGA